jgi:hypothetical protein
LRFAELRSAFIEFGEQSLGKLHVFDGKAVIKVGSESGVKLGYASFEPILLSQEEEVELQGPSKTELCDEIIHA